MHNKKQLNLFFLILLTIVLVASCSKNQSKSKKKLKINSFKIKGLSESNYNIGSGLSYKKRSPYGSIEFYSVSDNSFSATDQKAPDALISLLKLRKDKVSIKKFFPIFVKDKLPKKTFLDFEGIAVAPNNNIWLCDESYPSLIEFDPKKGEVKQVLYPGNGLPIIFSKRKENKAFEGIAVTPSGQVAVVMQRPLSEKDNFVRLLIYNPKSKSSKSFAYKLPKLSSSKIIKLSALQAISENEFLILEQEEKNGKAHKIRVFKINLIGASDVSSLLIDGELPESLEREELFSKKSSIKEIAKELIIEIPASKFKFEKIEGLSILPNGRTLVFINDAESYKNVRLITVDLGESIWTWDAKDWSIISILVLITALGLFFLFGIVFNYVQRDKRKDRKPKS